MYAAFSSRPMQLISLFFIFYFNSVAIFINSSPKLTRKFVLAMRKKAGKLRLVKNLLHIFSILTYFFLALLTAGTSEERGENKQQIELNVFTKRHTIKYANWIKHRRSIVYVQLGDKFHQYSMLHVNPHEFSKKLSFRFLLSAEALKIRTISLRLHLPHITSRNTCWDERICNEDDNPIRIN